MKKKLKRYQVTTNSETLAISLVESPAIESDFIALSEQKPVKIQMSDDYRHILYGAVLIPDLPIYRNDDGEEYYIQFSKESIEKMSQDFMKEYRQANITLDHETDANDIYVCESWIKESEYQDKSTALGLELPVGSWVVGVKVNQIDVWERIISGELRGFSVESLISMEELNFNKQNNNSTNMESDTMFWDKMKSLLKEFFKKEEQFETETTVDTVTETIEETTVEEPVTEETTVTETVEEQVQEETPETTEPEEVKVEDTETEPKDNHLNELIENLKAEIEALKKVNEGLETKVNGLSKEPSTKPINVNGKPNSGDAYSNWRSQMRSMMQ